QNGAWLHAGDALRINDAARLVIERQVERYHVGACEQRVEIDQRHARVRSRGAVPGDHLHADAARNARDLAADAAKPNDAERLVEELHALAWHPQATARVAVHPRQLARTGKHQRDGVLGDCDIAIALDGVHGDAERV